MSAICLAFILMTYLGCARSAEAFSVDATRLGDVVKISARATIRAPRDVIWNTLTDYDHLSEFIPGITTSRVIDRHGKSATVEQSGYARLWFFKYPIDVTVETLEKPPSEIRIHLLKGTLKQLEGRYRIEKIDGENADGENAYTLRWTGIIEPNISLPGIIATPLMRRNISEQFLGMVHEIERRASAQ